MCSNVECDGSIEGVRGCPRFSRVIVSATDRTVSFGELDDLPSDPNQTEILPQQCFGEWALRAPQRGETKAGCLAMCPFSPIATMNKTCSVSLRHHLEKPVLDIGVS